MLLCSVVLLLFSCCVDVLIDFYIHFNYVIMYIIIYLLIIIIITCIGCQTFPSRHQSKSNSKN